MAELEARLAHTTSLVRRLHLQYDVAGILADAEATDEAMSQILMAIGRARGWSLVQAWIFHDDQTAFYVWHEPAHDYEAFIQAAGRTDPEERTGLLREALTSREAVWADELQEHDMARQQAARQEGLSEVAAFALRNGSKVYGVIELLRREPVADREDHNVLYRLLGRDIGRFLEALRYEEELEKKNERLAQAQLVARMGHWDWRPATDRLFTNEGTQIALGLPPSLMPESLPAYLGRVPLEDRPRLQRALQYIENLELRDIEVEHAFESPSGLRMLVLRVQAQADRHGRLRKVVGMVQDVTERRRAELQMRATERRWASVFKNSPVPGIVTVAETGECLAANDEFLEWFGAGSAEVLGRTTVSLGLWSEGRRAELTRLLDERGYLRHYELQVRIRAGQRDVLFNVEPVDIDDRPCFLVTFVDLTERKVLEKQLRLTAAAVDQAAEAMVILDAQGVMVSVNPAFTRLTGYEAKEALGQSMEELLHRPTGRHDDDFFKKVVGSLFIDGHWEGDVWARRRDGEIFPELLSLSVIRGPDGGVMSYVGVFNDITGQKDQEERLRQMALYDSLTGLPNRSLLYEHVEKALSRADRRSRQVAVLFSDLDRFKPVNDTYGHEVGDRVLKEVGRRLAACVRSSDLVARLGGDEFVTVIEDVSSVEDAKEVAGKIVAAMAEPFHIGDITVQVGSSVGIAVYPEHGRHTRVLIRRADEALYDAKEAGRNGFQVWGTPA